MNNQKAQLQKQRDKTALINQLNASASGNSKNTVLQLLKLENGGVLS